MKLSVCWSDKFQFGEQTKNLFSHHLRRAQLYAPFRCIAFIGLQKHMSIRYDRRMLLCSLQNKLFLNSSPTTDHLFFRFRLNQPITIHPPSPRIFPLTASAFSCTIAQNPERSYGNDVQHASHDHHPAARGTVSAGLHCRTRFLDPPWVNGAFYGSRRCRSKQASICTVFSLSKGGRPYAGTVRAPPGEWRIPPANHPFSRTERRIL